MTALNGGSNGLEHLVLVRPWPAEELGDEPTLARSHRLPVDQDVELPRASLHELDGMAEALTDQSGETRRFGCSGRSRVAINDSNRHSDQYRPVIPVPEKALKARGHGPTYFCLLPCYLLHSAIRRITSATGSTSSIHSTLCPACQ